MAKHRTSQTRSRRANPSRRCAATTAACGEAVSRLFQCEALESRRLLATVSGVVYADMNDDGVYQAPDPVMGRNDTPLNTWLVFADANDNAKLDSGEFAAVSDFTTGTYTLDGLPAGTYKITVPEATAWGVTPVSVTVGTNSNINVSLGSLEAPLRTPVPVRGPWVFLDASPSYDPHIGANPITGTLTASWRNGSGEIRSGLITPSVTLADYRHFYPWGGFNIGGRTVAYQVTTSARLWGGNHVGGSGAYAAPLGLGILSANDGLSTYRHFRGDLVDFTWDRTVQFRNANDPTVGLPTQPTAVLGLKDGILYLDANGTLDPNTIAYEPNATVVSGDSVTDARIVMHDWDRGEIIYQTLANQFYLQPVRMAASFLDGPRVLLGSTASGYSFNDVMRLPSGDLLVAQGATSAASVNGQMPFLFQQFSAAGVPRGAMFAVGEHPILAGDIEKIYRGEFSTDQSGNTLFIWGERSSATDLVKLYAQRMQPDGSFTGAPFVANEYPGSDDNYSPEFRAFSADGARWNYHGMNWVYYPGVGNLYGTTLGAHALLHVQAFSDNNANGIQDEGENALPGVDFTVRSSDGDGTLNSSQDTVFAQFTTDSSGVWNSEPISLSEGDFWVSLDSGQNLGVLAGSEVQRAMLSGNTPDVTVSIPVQTMNVTGKVYIDDNRDGFFSPFSRDFPLRDIAIFADYDNDGTLDDIEPATTTGLDGSYTLNEVLVGQRTLRTVGGGLSIAAVPVNLTNAGGTISRDLISLAPAGAMNLGAERILQGLTGYADTRIFSTEIDQRTGLGMIQGGSYGGYFIGGLRSEINAEVEVLSSSVSSLNNGPSMTWPGGTISMYMDGLFHINYSNAQGGTHYTQSFYTYLNDLSVNYYGHVLAFNSQVGQFQHTAVGINNSYGSENVPGTTHIVQPDFPGSPEFAAVASGGSNLFYYSGGQQLPGSAPVAIEVTDACGLPDGRFAVLATAYASGLPITYLSIYTYNGDPVVLFKPIGSPIDLTQKSLYAPRLDADAAGNLLVVWMEQDRNSGEVEIQSAGINSDGTTRFDDRLISAFPHAVNGYSGDIYWHRPKTVDVAGGNTGRFIVSYVRNTAGLGMDAYAQKVLFGVGAEQNTGTVSVPLFVDQNGDQQIQPADTPIPNVQVTLYRGDSDGDFEPGTDETLVGSLLTDASGISSFSDLPYGVYWAAYDAESPELSGKAPTYSTAYRKVVIGRDVATTAANFAFDASIMVSTAVDELDSNHDVGDLSLREALVLARELPGTARIVFDSSLAGQILTLSPARGQLVIDGDYAIQGPVGGVTISANNASRVFLVESGASLTLDSFTIANGQTTTGGLIFVDDDATLNLQAATLRNGTASGRGGAIFVSSTASLAMDRSTITQGTAGFGGAIFADFDSTISIDRSTLYANSASTAGGAVLSNGDLAIANSTFSGNSTNGNGGALSIDYGNASIINSTFAENHADADGNNSGSGGAILIASSSTVVHNTLLMGNLRKDSLEDMSGLLDPTSSFNFISAGAAGLDATNLLGTPATPLDAKLYPLADYGGGTLSYALRPESPAIDAGDNALATAAGLSTDQLGNLRLQDFDGESTATVDIGAFEASPIIWVDSLLDEVVDTDSLTSLREAVALANSRSGFDLIRFDPSLLSGGLVSVPISHGQLVIGSIIDLAGFADDAAVLAGDGSSRLLHVTSSGSVILSDLTVSGGSHSSGGGMRNEGSAILSRMTFASNHSSGDGGAIWNSGTMSGSNVTISANAADGSGGGVYNAGGSLDMLNVTIVNNGAAALGGAGSGGGVRVVGGTVWLGNSLVAQNTTGVLAQLADDVSGSFDSNSSHNFIGAIDGSSGLTGTGTQYGIQISPADPKITALDWRGGGTQTHGLLPASPLTDAGSDGLASILSTDQRGQDRTRDGNDDAAVRVDIGAFEQQYPLNQSPTLSSLSTIGGAVEGVGFTLTYETLRAASNAADPDGDTIGFRIESITAGSLTRNGQPVVTGETVLWPGESLIWTPPTIDFGNDSSKTIEGFTVKAFDNQIASSTALPVNITVRTVAQPINYALLFSGGDRIDLNYPIYYNDLKRLYGVLINQYGLRPEDICIVYADGRNAAPDMKGGLNSDMSFAPNSTVLSGTSVNLRNTLQLLSGKIDQNDHFFFWTFDHGLGETNRPAVTGEEVLKGWGVNEIISDEQLRVWTQGLQVTDNPSLYGVPADYGGIQAGYSTYLFAQCFSGGMLDDMTLSTNVFGAASSNHYEASYADYFAAPFTDALALGYNNTRAAYQYAIQNDSRARSSPPNGGAWAFNIEHPWSGGGEFPIFASSRDQNATPELHSIAPLRIDTAATQLEITYDMLVAASDGTDPTGQALSFRLTSEDIGELWRDGVRINLNNAAQSTISYGQNFIWKKPVGASGTLNAFKLKLVAPDGAGSLSRVAPVRIGAAPGLSAVNDNILLQVNSIDSLLNVLENDSGVGLSILRVGVPDHGQLSLDPATGQLRYTPAIDYLGEDQFSYLITDGGNTDLATVHISTVSYDPASASAQNLRFNFTELPPPPGWAGLPKEWEWSYRDGVPDWTQSTAVDISDDGVVLVKVSRANSTSLDYIGSTNASYRWQSGDVEPYWNTTPDGSISATNTLMLLLETPFTHNGRQILQGVQGVATGNPAAMPLIRYLDPDNANEAGFPSTGGIWYDVGKENAFFQELPDNVYPQQIALVPTNAPTFMGIANDKSPTGQRGQLWSFDSAGSNLIATINGTGGSGRSEARALNQAGQVVGWIEYAPNDYRAFSYHAGNLLDLGALPGFVESVATAVNEDGVIVGYSSSNIGAADSGAAFVYANGTMSALPALGGSGWSIARDINANGVIVGSSNGIAVLWRDGEVFDLNSLTNDVPAGALLTSVEGINHSGQMVVSGLINGQNSAFFLDLASALETTDDLVQTDNRTAVAFNPLSNDPGARSVVHVDDTELDGVLSWDADGNFSFDPAAAFDDLPVGQSRQTQFSYVVNDGRGGSESGIVTINVTGVPALSTFHVANFAQTDSGFKVQLSHDPNLNVLNLYDGQDAALDLPDLTLSRQSGGNVKGSLVWDAPSKTLEFIATGGVLPADVYTVTLFSRADGFVSSAGLLDGDADNSAGGNYSTQFTVTASTARTVSLSDFSRGPDQPVNLPATGTGIAMQLSDGNNVRSIDFVLRYDPNLLNISTINLASGMPAGWSVQSNLTTPGQATVSVFGTTALPAGARSILSIAASVPSTAIYGASHAIKIDNLSLNEGEIPSKSDTAVHQVAYVGDATGNRNYSGLDASLAARVAVNLDSGFDAYRLTDPAIVADVTGDKNLSGLDAAYIAAKAAELDQPQIPDLPATAPLPSSPLPSDLPRSITIGSGSTDPGQTIDIPVTIDSGEGVQAFDFIIHYDTTKLDIDNLAVTLGSLMPAGWSAAPNVNESTGRIVVSAYNTQSLGSGEATLLTLHFTSLPSATGSAALTLAGSLNEGLIDVNITNGQVQIGAAQLPGDANNDGKVNTLDFNILAHHFGGANKTFAQGDFNNDTMADSIDFGIFIAHYGRAQTATAPLSMFAEQEVMEDDEEG